MTMNDEVNQNYGRRVDDLIQQVKAIQQEAEDFLRGRAPPGVTSKQIRAKQTMALKALNQAMAMQQELLDQMATTGEPVYPSGRRSTDQPFESMIRDIQVRAGIK